MSEFTVAQNVPRSVTQDIFCFSSALFAGLTRMSAIPQATFLSFGSQVNP
jgi:hypothetical protein